MQYEAPPVPGQLAAQSRQVFRPTQTSAWTVAYNSVHTPPPPVAFTQLDASVLARALGVAQRSSGR